MSVRMSKDLGVKAVRKAIREKGHNCPHLSDLKRKEVMSYVETLPVVAVAEVLARARVIQGFEPYQEIKKALEKDGFVVVERISHKGSPHLLVSAPGIWTEQASIQYFKKTRNFKVFYPFLAKDQKGSEFRSWRHVAMFVNELFEMAGMIR